jgi:hypothetical protein
VKAGHLPSWQFSSHWHGALTSYILGIYPRELKDSFDFSRLEIFSMIASILEHLLKFLIENTNG